MYVYHAYYMIFIPLSLSLCLNSLPFIFTGLQSTTYSADGANWIRSTHTSLWMKTTNGSKWMLFEEVVNLQNWVIHSSNKQIYIYLWYIKYRYIFVNINGQFTTYDDVAISASEFIRSLESAWREVTCSSDSKCNTIIDNVIDRVRQLQRLYVPSDEPIEMGWQY